MLEVVVGNTSVKVKTGDITTESTDAIVNLNNGTLNQNFGVSKEILAAAGDTVQKECASLGTLGSDEYAVTEAGKLKCKKIIHLVDVTSSRIVESMKRALKACDEHKIRTVSLPAFGTGTASLDPQSSIKLIFEGLEGYLTEVGTSTIILEITIVVNKQDVYEGYMTFFHNYQTNYSYFKANGKAIVLNKGDITNQSVECILNLTNSSLNQSTGVSKAILNAAGDAVKDECKSIGIASVQPEDSIKAILSAILRYLEKPSTITLESVSIVVLQEDVYKSYLKFFLENRTELQKKVERAQVIIDFPKSWTNMGEKELLVITLEENCEEYEKVKENFLATAKPTTFTVLKIERIQNELLFKKFSLSKQEVERKNPNQQNVRLLYHGTYVDSIKNINEEGFNRSYCSVTAYGKGSYFAVNSEYSSRDIYSKPDKDGKKYIYQATVVTGKHCKGTPEMREPPYIGSDPDAGRYNSVTDDVNNPSMFVVFYDNYAYPDYLITFKLGI
ncbi:PREDICTED: poly [ADP-ribose] polymerase 15-like [Nanorana parkeri]|uniref:poly [ADP-ribose] polymerase 15-like n=1 Tax=Nanorana parkeri TaxID=125878 RepID=UPI000854F36B|nr:PREDICTED: poly [ADP-ribose] polymerase 15-like [Nanorana parkeri]